MRIVEPSSLHMGRPEAPAPSRQAGTYLILLGALGELPELGVELREAPCDLLYTCVQVTVLTVLSVEVVLVALALLRGGDGGVFSGEMGEEGWWSSAHWQRLRARSCEAGPTQEVTPPVSDFLA